MTKERVEEAVKCIIDCFVTEEKECKEAWAYWEGMKRACKRKPKKKVKK